MLHKETVELSTFALLEKLQDLPILHDFHLVGGTALALQFGHRQSIDLDLFGYPLEKQQILSSLKSEFSHSFQFIESPISWSLFCKINAIKVDLIQYQHPLLYPLIDDEVRMYDYRDIAAMKINAVLNRGTKKDFWDIYELFEHMTFDEMIEVFERKYPDQRLLISIPQALVYFQDAESDPNPICLKNRTWEEVKTGITKCVSQYLS